MIYDDNGTHTINGTTFSGNTATQNGGAIYNYSGTIGDIIGDFSNNYVEGKYDVSGKIGAIGGAISNNTTVTSGISGTFTNNSATSQGGAIQNYAGYITDGISNSTFSGNHAADGGAIWNQSSSLAITDSSFTNNYTTTGNGGAIYSSGNLTINAVNDAVTFSGNQVKTSSTAVANDIYMDGGTGAPIDLSLNAADTTKKISLGGGVAGTNYNVNICGEETLFIFQIPSALPYPLYQGEIILLFCSPLDKEGPGEVC